MGEEVSRGREMGRKLLTEDWEGRVEIKRGRGLIKLKDEEDKLCCNVTCVSVYAHGC